MNTPLRESQFRGFVAAAICLLTVLAYSNTFTNGFVWDDASSVLLHKHVQDPSKFTQLFKEDLHAFGRGQGTFYRPLVAATLMADFALAFRGPREASDDSPGIPDVNPFLFHATNTFCHGLAALLLFALLTRLEAPRFVRAVTPLLYAVHPLHTEAVAYISGRADSMAAAFMFAGLWFALWEKTPVRRAIGIVFSALCFAAALLSKESAAIFPALLLLVAVAGAAVVGNAPKNLAYALRLLPVLASLVVLGAYAYLRFAVLAFKSESAPSTSTLWQRIVETGQAFALYIRLIFVPTGLHMERTLDGVPGWVALLGGILVAGCIALLYVQGVAQERRRVAMALGWFLITWFPISGLIPLNAPMAEHWMYVPLAGFLWALAELVWPLLRSPLAKRSGIAVAYAACVAFTIMTLLRNRDWRSDESLYLATLQENPNSVRVHYNLAVVYDDLLGNIPGARRQYESVIRLRTAQKLALPRKADTATYLWDDELEAHLSLGDMSLEQGRYDEATNHYTTVLNVRPNERNAASWGMAAFGMGRCFLEMGNRDQADKCFTRALQVFPNLKQNVDQLLLR